VNALYDQRESLKLDAESLRLLEITYDGFVKSGALLSEPSKNTLKALNTEQSTLQAKFINCVLAAMKEGGLHIATREALDGLSEAELREAEEAAKSRGLEGFYLSLQNTTQQPLLASLNNRDTRKALWEASLHRAEKGNESDTQAMVARLAQLRAQRAALLGYENYAAWKLDDQMARTPQAAVKFLDNLVPAALAGAKQEAEAMRALIEASDGGFTLEPWDWAFYAEKVRKAQYDINEDEVKQYFELSRVFEDGVLFAATELYGITFRKRTDLPVYHPDVVTYEVFNADGSHLALLYCDFYRRDSKRGGAWMSSLLTQSSLLGDAPIITNVCNYTKPSNGEPSLVDSDEVQTLFHEFGHALHGLFSDAVYPSLSGTSVPRDFVEFPSQFNEHWATNPQVFHHFAKNYKTGEPMPNESFAKIKNAATFNKGYGSMEALAAQELDMQWHLLPASAPLQDVDVFEKAALERTHVAMEQVPPRYRTSYFMHIWANGYAAGYYAYAWAEMLDDDAYQWFEDHGGLTRANGDRFRQMVLSRGNTEDLKTMYTRWLGAEPSVAPMLKARGLTAEGAR
jgi:peptidyl-dipeptidase Dcp